jgi:hypothetical protein
MEQILTEKKVSIIRKYPVETLVSILIAAVGFISWRQAGTEKKVDQLQVEMKGYLHEDRRELIKTLEKTNDVMTDVKDYLKASKK